MIELQTSVKQDDTTRTRTPKPGYLNLCTDTFQTGLGCGFGFGTMHAHKSTVKNGEQGEKIEVIFQNRL
jgi:hypothetical protein